jgi:hypothetical protein
MAAIDNITLSEVQEFYPVTASLDQTKINILAKHVKNVVFLQMFGYSISTEIFSGVIPDSQAGEFIGFRALVAMCIARQQVQEVYVHTNAGLKAVNQPNWSSPALTSKHTSLLELNNAVELQFLEAKKALSLLNEKPLNSYEPYSSFKIDKI